MKYNDIYSELSELVGHDNMLKLYEYYKGQQINFPAQLYNKQIIRQQIISEYDGTNSKQLAKKYGYSERWIYHIIHTEKNQIDG